MPDGETPVGENVSVRIRSLGSSGDGATIIVTTDADGSFYSPIVPRGQFVLTADTGTPDDLADNPVDMETEAFDTLNVRLYGQTSGYLPSGGDITASIRLNDMAGVHVVVVDSENKSVPGAVVTLKTVSTLDGDEEGTFIKLTADDQGIIDFVITSYSIHYTKLYDIQFIRESSIQDNT